MKNLKVKEAFAYDSLIHTLQDEYFVFGIYAEMTEEKNPVGNNKRPIFEILIKKTDGYDNYETYDNNAKCEFIIYGRFHTYGRKNDYDVYKKDHVYLDTFKTFSTHYDKAKKELEEELEEFIRSRINRGVPTYIYSMAEVEHDKILERAEKNCRKEMNKYFKKYLEILKDFEKNNELEIFLEYLFKEAQKTNLLLQNSNSFKELCVPYLVEQNNENKNTKKSRR